MPYGDPYSNINSIVGQGYAQDASIRGQGIDQASALTQHFIDAFTRAQQEAYQRKMQESQIMHQRAQEAAAVARQQALDSNNLYDDWSKTGQEANVPAFEQRAKLLGVPSPVPEQQFHPAVPAFTGGSDQALAPENNPTVDIGGESQQVQLMPQNTGGMEKSPIPRQGSIFGQMQQKQDRADAVAQLNAESKALMAQLASERNPDQIKLLQARIAQVDSAAANIGVGNDIRRERLKIQQGKLDLSTRTENRLQQNTEITRNSSVAAGNALVDTANANFDNVVNVAKGLMNHPGLPYATGLAHSIGISSLGGTDARGAKAQIDSLKAQLGLQAMADMRAASKSGSTGLGAVTEAEHKLLQNMIAALDPGMKTEDFKRELQKVIDRVAISREIIRKKYEEDIGSGLYQNRGMSSGGGIPPELQGAPQNIIDTYNRGGVVEGPNGQRFSKGR